MKPPMSPEERQSLLKQADTMARWATSCISLNANVLNDTYKAGEVEKMLKALTDLARRIEADMAVERFEALDEAQDERDAVLSQMDIVRGMMENGVPVSAVLAGLNRVDAGQTLASVRDKAWTSGYLSGVNDERTSVAVTGGIVGPARPSPWAAEVAAAKGSAGL